MKWNAENAQMAIEVKEGADPMVDPFKKQKAEKKLGVAKQKLREMRNKVERAGFKLAPVSLEKTGINFYFGRNLILYHNHMPPDESDEIRRTKFEE